MSTPEDIQAAPHLDAVFAGPLAEALTAGVHDVLFRAGHSPVGVTGRSGTAELGEMVGAEEFDRAAATLPSGMGITYISNTRYRFHKDQGSISFRRVPGPEEMETGLGEIATEVQPTGDKAFHALLRAGAASNQD